MLMKLATKKGEVGRVFWDKEGAERQLGLAILNNTSICFLS